MRRTWLALFLLYSANCALAQQALVVGSKRFTESYILGEIALQTARSAGASSRAQARHGQHGNPVRCNQERQHRSLP